MSSLTRLGLTLVVALSASAGCFYQSDDSDALLDPDDDGTTTTTAGGGGTFETDPTQDVGDCDPMAENACGDGLKCTVAYDLVSEAETKCVPVTGSDEVGASCVADEPLEGSDSCVEGAICLTNFADRTPSQPQCVAFCDRGGLCDAQGTECINAFGMELPVCLQPCDPLDTTTCDDPWVCHEDPGNARWYCAPRLEGMEGGHGSGCVPNALGLCAPGHVCMQDFAVDSPDCHDASSDQGCCASLCQVDAIDDAPCPSELERCHPLYDAPPPGFENVGVCVVLQSDP